MLRSFCALWLVTVCANAFAADGYLVIGDGLDEFVRLAGGPEANIIVIPTSAGLADYGEQFQQNYFRSFRDRGVTRIRLLHASDRETANSEAFVAPIAAATGVWFTGGRQWRSADAYLDTRTERALWDLLKRGGVIGGTSAGATIQGSYLVRGDTRGALIAMGDHERGFGFLPNSAIDQHLLPRNRHFDLVDVIRMRPDLIGIGIDEGAAIVVHGDEFRVLAGYVAIYDPKIVAANGRFYFLEKGERFDLAKRIPMTEKGEPLWMPQILPPFTFSQEELHSIGGTYVAADGPITVRIKGKQIVAELCAGDPRELIPISHDILYDKIDGSRITLLRDEHGAVTGLSWKIARYVGHRLCREGTVEAAKKKE